MNTRELVCKIACLGSDRDLIKVKSIRDEISLSIIQCASDIIDIERGKEPFYKLNGINYSRDAGIEFKLKNDKVCEITFESTSITVDLEEAIKLLKWKRGYGV